MDPLSSVLDQMDDDEDFDFDPPECLVPQFTAADLPNLNTNNAFSAGRGQDAESTSSASSESKTKFLYPHLDTVELLRPEEIRWFFKEPTDRKWTPFIGYDSLRIECKYRELQGRKVESIAKEIEENKRPEDVPLDPEHICVRGSLFEVDVKKKMCFPIYWSSTEESSEVLRGTWFYETTWQPMEEELADQIETRHLQKFEHHKVPANRTEPHKGIQPVFTKLDLKDRYVEWNAIDYISLHFHTTSSKINRAVRSKLGMSAKAGTRLNRGYCHEAKMDDKPADISHLVFVVHGIGQKMEQGSIVRSCADLRETASRLFSKLDPAQVKYEAEKKRVEFLPCEWRSNLKLDGDIVDKITPRKIPGLRAMLNASAMDILYYTSPLYRSEITHGLQSELNRLYNMFCARHPYFEASGGKASIVAHSLGCVIVYDIITGWNPIQLYDQYVSQAIKSSAIVGNQLYFSLSSPELEETCNQVETATELLSQLETARKKVSELESDLLKLAEKQHLKTPTLKFRLENFFCLGSPLAVFLALRGVRPKGNGTQDQILPRSLCSRLFNLFHPSDPVAYRLEPLILKHYEGLMPLRVHRADALVRPAYDKMPAKAYPAAVINNMETKELVLHDLENLTDAIQNADSAGKKERNNNTDTDTDDGKKSEAEGQSKASPLSAMFRTKPSEANDIELSTGSSSSKKALSSADKYKVPNPDQDSDNSWINVCYEGGIEPTDMDHRMDFMLKEGKMENSYVAALTSHTAYWGNSDVALFLLMQLYPDHFTTEEPSS